MLFARCGPLCVERPFVLSYSLLSDHHLMGPVKLELLYNLLQLNMIHSIACHLGMSDMPTFFWAVSLPQSVCLHSCSLVNSSTYYLRHMAYIHPYSADVAPQQRRLPCCLASSSVLHVVKTLHATITAALRLGLSPDSLEVSCSSHIICVI